MNIPLHLRGSPSPKKKQTPIIPGCSTPWPQAHTRKSPRPQDKRLFDVAFRPTQTLLSNSSHIYTTSASTHIAYEMDLPILCANCHLFYNFPSASAISLITNPCWIPTAARSTHKHTCDHSGASRTESLSDLPGRPSQSYCNPHIYVCICMYMYIYVYMYIYICVYMYMLLIPLSHMSQSTPVHLRYSSCHK